MRVGVIGCGRWGKNAARTVDNARELAWLYDSDPAASAHLGKLFGARVVSEPAWADCDAVWIATPIETHEMLAHEAIGRGKHVLCEKPVARTKAAALGLVEHAARAGVTLMADHTWLGHAGVRAVVAPPIYDYEAMRFAQDARGFDPIDDLLPHDVALMRHGLGKDITRARWTEREQSIEMECGGDDGAGRGWLECVYNYSAPTKARMVRTWSSADGYRVNDGSLPEGSLEPLAVIYAELVAAIRERRDPTIGGPDELVHVAAVIEAAKRSRASGGEWCNVE